jgi:hypothetical protein
MHAPIAATIQTLEIGGDRFTMGRLLGRAVGQFMHTHLAASSRWQSVQEQRASDRVRAMEHAARRAFPHCVQEIEGLAAGADLPFDQVFAWHCHYELREPTSPPLAGGIEEGPSTSPPQARGTKRDPSTSPPPAGGIEGGAPHECTTLIWSTEDGALIAHNEDGMALYHEHCLWVQARPDEGQAYAGFHYPGLLCGNCFYVNSAGVVHATNHIADPPVAGGVPRQIVLRAVVDCASLSALTGLLRRTRRASGCHHTAAQVGGGPALSIEAPAAGVSVLRLAASYAHSNHLVHPALAGTGQPASASSQARLERAQALLAQAGGPLGVADLGEILADQENAELPIYMERVDSLEDTRTVATATFEVSREGVQWAVHGSPRGPVLLRGRAGASRAGASPAPT